MATKMYRLKKKLCVYSLVRGIVNEHFENFKNLFNFISPPGIIIILIYKEKLHLKNLLF